MKSILDSQFGPIGTLEALVKAGQYLGAHGLRYAVDALRRRGARIGGITTWVFNEPWPNGGRPNLVDYDGRPLMTYDFQIQALAPLSLSLKHSSNLFDPSAGLDAELWLVSDAPAPTCDLRWRWLLRNATGGVLARDEGGASIKPMQAIHLGAVKSGSMDEDTAGLLLVELQLHSSEGDLLSERVHIFGSSAAPAPLAGLISDAAPGLARTTLKVSDCLRQQDGGGESLQIALTNSGDMTALFCEPHPVHGYRTDIDMENNHVFIPPGETRVITISARTTSDKELSLAETGWRITCWNADDLTIAPGDELLFAIGRRDAMAREFQGFSDTSTVGDKLDLTITGNCPEPSALPFLMTGDRTVRFQFDIIQGWWQPSRLRLHTADQDSERAVQLLVTVNGNQFEGSLPTGLGIQVQDPAHLAFPQTAELYLPAGTLQKGGNSLEIQISNAAWFTWDAIDLTIME